MLKQCQRVHVDASKEGVPKDILATLEALISLRMKKPTKKINSLRAEGGRIIHLACLVKN